MIVHTESGSVYEVRDEEPQAVRRLSVGGSERATCEWQPCESVVFTADNRLLITWTRDVPLMEGSPDDSVACTLTSGIDYICDYWC